MSLTPPAKVRKLRDALHSKAKDAPGYRFYALYDKLYRDDILRFAYDRCKANGGAPGVDGQDFEDIEAQGTACRHTEILCNTGSPPRRWRVTTDRTPARDRPGRAGVAERPVVPTKPGNAGGGKGPWFRTRDAKVADGREIGDEPNTSTQGQEAPGRPALES